MSPKLKQKKKQKVCQTCEFITNDEHNLKRHKRDKHDMNSASTSPPPKKTKVDIKCTQENMEIDEQNLEDMDVDIIEDEAGIRSRLMDEKIEAKAKKIEEEERIYRETKKKEEERKKAVEALEKEKREQSIRQQKQKVKDVKRKNRKKNDMKTKDIHNIPNIKPLPLNIAHLCNKGDVVYTVPGDGACAPNSISAHLFNDEVFGPRLRRKMNDFKVKHWNRKYKLKTQCSPESPFVRKIGNKGEKISFTDSNKLFEYLVNADEADYMWTDCDDLIVLADMYQVKIKVITTKGENDENPSVNWIHPDEEMKEFSELKNVEIDDIVLLHENDIHYNLIIAGESDLAKIGSLSFMTNMAPIANTDEQESGIKNKKSFANVVAKGSKPEEHPKDELEKIKKALELSNKRNKSLEKQYDDCELALRKITEEYEKQKSELKDLRKMLKIEKEIGETSRKDPQEDTNSQNIGNTESESSFQENILEEVNIEGEFNCLECAFQGTLQSQLDKHIQIKHRIHCRNCEKSFKTKPELMAHRRSDHYDIVAVCRNGMNCKFLDRCWWKHKKDDEHGLIECYYCDLSFVNKGEVMKHRKDKHIKTVKICSKFENNSCIRDEERCWYKHENIEKEKQKSSCDTNSVFWKAQNNLIKP